MAATDKTASPTFVVLTNQARDIKDLGMWDAEGPVPNASGNLPPEERRKINDRRAKAISVRLGSMDDRGRKDALSPSSKPIPLDVFRAMVRHCAALRGWIKAVPAQVTHAVVQDPSDVGLDLAGLE